MQLTQEERYQIYALNKPGHPQAEIGEIVGHDPGMISRELRPNRGLKGYRPQQAHKLALARGFDDWEARDLDAHIYLAHPYASWERGLNEDTNGLIRQYFPKHRDLTTVTQREIKKAVHKLNHRPRKSVGYRTPYEVFFSTKTSLTVPPLSLN